MEAPGALDRRNIELKAACPDLEAAHRAARSVGAAFSGRERQHDTYFTVARGRLKLRRRWGQDGRPAGAQLIWYRRADEDRPRPSDYLLVPLEEADDLLAALEGALGVAVEVVKDRSIYLADEVRIHLDTVTGLGAFLEFEAIVGPAGDADARKRLDRLAAAFGVTAERVVRVSYSDLVESRKSEGGSRK